MKVDPIAACVDAAKDMALYLNLAAGDFDAARKIRRGYPRWNDRPEVLMKRVLGYERYRQRYRRIRSSQ